MAEPLFPPPSNRREELHDILVECLGSGQVYFQPPDDIQMVYPAIVYNRDYDATQFAGNKPYRQTWRYMVTVMDEDPDSPVVQRVRQLPMSSFVRSFAADQLNHDIFSVYY